MISKEIFDLLRAEREIRIDYNIRVNEFCEAPPMDIYLRNRLLDLYRDDIKDLEEIIKKNLDKWR